jgi:uncharacterized protein YciI
LPDGGTRECVSQVVLDRILAPVNRLQIKQRLPQPAPQETPAHRGAGLVDYRKESVPFLSASTFRQLQIAARLEIQLHEAGRAIRVDRGDLDERRALSVGEVGEQRPGCLDCHPLLGQTESVQRLHREVLQQRFASPLRLPEPGIETADRQTCRQPFFDRRAISIRLFRGKNDFDSAETLYFTSSGRLHFVRGSCGELGSRKLARRKIRVGNPSPRPLADHRGDVAVAMAVEHCRVGHGPRRHDAGHIAIDQCPPPVQPPDLLTDGDFVSGRHEPSDVPISRMVRNPGHRNADALAHFPAGEHDVQDTCRGFRIVLERLVEISKAEEEDGVRKSLLDLEILAANRWSRLEGGAFLRERRASVWQQHYLRVGSQCALSVADLSARGGERGRLGYADTGVGARSERRPSCMLRSREGIPMGLFAALIEFTEDEELRLQTRPVHREYLRSLFDAGNLAISGPWADDTGALIVYEAKDMVEAERMLDGDPYRRAGVIANATLKEWRVVMRASWSNESP